jgi:hypothetical protein
LQELQKTGTATGLQLVATGFAVAVAVAQLGLTFPTCCNWLQPLLSQHVIREDFGDENKSKITQNGQEMAKL